MYANYHDNNETYIANTSWGWTDSKGLSKFQASTQEKGEAASIPIQEIY